MFLIKYYNKKYHTQRSMNRWVCFGDKVLEANYQSYITKNMLKDQKILAFTVASYGSLNILIAIIEHFISDFEYHKEIEWLTLRLITIITGCIIFSFTILISKKNSGKKPVFNSYGPCSPFWSLFLLIPII